MSKMFVFMCAFFLYTQSASALLAPLEQEIVEIRTILSDTKLRDAIGSGEIIESIQKIEGGYALHTAKQTVNVEVKHLPAKRPGPVQFELNFKN